VCLKTQFIFVFSCFCQIGAGHRLSFEHKEKRINFYFKITRSVIVDVLANFQVLVHGVMGPM